MPRNVNASLKAADRIPGLRPKVEKPRGAPPPWVDWIHKFGPLLSVIASAAIFVLTIKYTVEPVYKRALLEEANARLEIESQNAKQRLLAVNDLVAKSTVELKAKTEQIGSLSAQIAKQSQVAADASKQAMVATTNLADAQSTLLVVKQDLGSKIDALDNAKTSLDETERRLIEVIVDSSAGRGNQPLSPCLIQKLNANFRGAETESDFTFKKCVTSTLESSDALLRRLSEPVRLIFLQIARRIDAESEPKLLELAKAASIAASEHAALEARQDKEYANLAPRRDLKADMEAGKALMLQQRKVGKESLEKVRAISAAIDKVVSDDHARFVAEVKGRSLRSSANEPTK
jgi:hypothetical protein